MKKSSIYVLSTFFAILAFWIFTLYSEENIQTGKVDEGKITAIIDKKTQSNSDIPSTPINNNPIKNTVTHNDSQYLGYKITVGTKLVTDLDKIEEIKSLTTFDIVLQKSQFAESNLKGLVTNLKIDSASFGDINDNNPLGFTYSYEGPQIYRDVDLLGLDLSHPLGITAYVLSSISYSDSPSPIIFQEPSRTVEYTYQISANGDKASRVMQSIIPISQTDDTANLSSDYQETWSARLNTNKRIASAASHGTLSATLLLPVESRNDQANNADVTLTQEIFITATQFTPSNVSFPDDLFAFNANKKFNTALVASTNNKIIESDETFYTELDKLSTSLSFSDSIIVGEYLLSYKTIAEVKGMLSDDTLTALERQAILMAIQNANKPESEVYLSSVVMDAEVPDRFRNAGMVNLALVESSTQITLNALDGVMQQKEAPSLVETALYNIGNLARSNPALANESNGIILDIIDRSADGSREKVVALRAAANSDNDVFTSSFVKSLESEAINERYAAVEGALRREGGKEEALNRLVKEDSAIVMIAAAKYYSSNEMPAAEQEKFYERLVNETNPEIQEALTSVLLSGKGGGPNNTTLKKLEELAQTSGQPGVKKVVDIYKNDFHQQQLTSSQTTPQSQDESASTTN
ncbi:hypothetical protein A1OQ_17985 [Enterovibrio norvegicus FF-162]|uniref:hypothetical protein n=1 Tax=Enterovibrio norvegicus TaxID=188144 RepID=UPI0002DCBA47|nr:hypothetical protein [Enterovibrio norvegicus]OEE85321.1 hypothetical protein A1OQ_17985 [Enterovibrio norvegicus FF-162]